jgi:hypothetical protein
MLLTTLLALSTAAQAGAADWQLRATSGLWFVHNPAAGITLTAPELGVSAQWRGLEVGVVDHAFLTLAGVDHLYGPELRWTHAWGEGTWAPYSSLGASARFGGPAPVLPIARGEGGAVWHKGHLHAHLGADLMGSYRAFGGGPRLAFGGSF